MPDFVNILIFILRILFSNKILIIYKHVLSSALVYVDIVYLYYIYKWHLCLNTVAQVVYQVEQPNSAVSSHTAKAYFKRSLRGHVSND